MRTAQYEWGRIRRRYLAALLLTVALVVMTTSVARGSKPGPVVIEYDNFGQGAGSTYTLTDYYAKWFNPYGLGEMADVDTRAFDGQVMSIDAAPFTTSWDFSVYDHIKYLAISTESFEVPESGSVTFSMDIQAETPGTIRDYVIEGTYIESGEPYAAAVLEGQQAGATLHMIDFETGQLFDWFVSGTKAFTLIERLPSSVTGSHADPNDPEYVGRDKMYTQIIKEVPIAPGKQHNVAITFGRDASGSYAEWHLNGKLISRVERVGVPLDVQGESYTGIYPSLGPGEDLGSKVSSVVIGKGAFSLIDAFPFQHPEAPELAVSIPVENRIFGQGVIARYDNVRVEIRSED